MYSPYTGRFLTKDPSGAESNLYIYAKSDPINYSDPSGLFSKRDVASALWMFGIPHPDDFGLFLNEVENTASGYGAHPKWGLIAALLDASPGDKLEAYNVAVWGFGSMSIFNTPGFRKVADAHLINAERSTLSPFYMKTLLGTYQGQFGYAGNHGIEDDTDARYYVLQSQKGGIKKYVDGSTYGEYPDFKISTLNAADSIKEALKRFGVKLGKLSCFTYSSGHIVDRYGQVYTFDSPGISLGFSIGAFGNGWASPGYISDPIALRNAIEGISYGSSVSAVHGLSASYSPRSRAGVYIESTGFQLGITFVERTRVRYEYTDPSLRWDWADKWEMGAYGSPPAIFRNNLESWSPQ